MSLADESLALAEPFVWLANIPAAIMQFFTLVVQEDQIGSQSADHLHTLGPSASQLVGRSLVQARW